MQRLVSLVVVTDFRNLMITVEIFLLSNILKHEVTLCKISSVHCFIGRIIPLRECYSVHVEETVLKNEYKGENESNRVQECESAIV